MAIPRCMFLSERRLPVCSPALVARLPLADITDLGRHTLLHVATMPRLWNDWLRAAGATEVDQAAALTFDHFYLAVQAALDGLGVAMGPTALVADDRAAGRLITPFPDVSLPARSYHAYLTEPGPPIPPLLCFASGYRRSVATGHDRCPQAKVATIEDQLTIPSNHQTNRSGARLLDPQRARV